MSRDIDYLVKCLEDVAPLLCDDYQTALEDAARMLRELDERVKDLIVDENDE